MNQLQTFRLVLLPFFVSIQLMCLKGFSQTEIKGKLENCRSCKVQAIVDNSDFETSKEFIPSQPDRYGNFVFELKSVHRPDVVLLEIDARKIPVYVEPNKKTWITIKKSGDSLNYNFENNLVNENSHLTSFYQQFGWLSDKEIGSLWFEKSLVSFPQQLYEQYMNKPDYLKTDYLIDLTKQMNDFARFQVAPTATKEYKNLIQTYSKHASLAYLYNLASLGKQSITDQQKITQLTYSNQFHPGDRLNAAFIPHLKSYVNYYTKKADLSEENFGTYFDFIWQNATQIPLPLREEYLIYLIEKNISPYNVQAFKSTIKDFIRSLSDIDEMSKLMLLYEDAKQRANGMLAPDFSLESSEGNFVSLQSLRGKNIHLAFWSSSCKPCIEGMQKSVETKKYLKDENVVFVYISSDLSKSVWLSNKWVKSAAENDIHLWAGQSSVELKPYNAITLPTYYFINKNGGFVVDFPKSWEPGFMKFIKNLP